MTLDQLSMFIAVVEGQTFSAAAQKLRISQPSISVAIKNLEEELKLVLFDRAQYRPRLTPEGECIYRKAKEILMLEKDLKEGARLLVAGEEPFMRIILDIVAPLPKILTLIQAYFAHEQACRLELSFCVLGKGLKKVVDNEADLYIGPIFEEVENIDSRYYCDYFMIPVISKNNIYASLALADIKTNIEKIPRVILKNSKPESEALATASREDRTIYVEDFLIKKETIMAGLGWGRLPLWNIETELREQNLIDLREVFWNMKISGEIFIVPKAKNSGKHLKALLQVLL